MTVTVTFTTPRNQAPSIAYYASDRAEAAAWVAQQQRNPLNRAKTYSF